MLNSRLALRQIDITALSGKDLPKADVIGFVDAFCQVVFAGIMYETVVKKREYNPNWIHCYSEPNTEMDMSLIYDGKQLCNSQCSLSIMKLRLKNAGFVIFGPDSGCDRSDLKAFFLSYDTKLLSADEFAIMMMQTSGVTTLFTGTESGGSIMKSLSGEQVQALLRHEIGMNGLHQAMM